MSVFEWIVIGGLFLVVFMLVYIERRLINLDKSLTGEHQKEMVEKLGRIEEHLRSLKMVEKLGRIEEHLRSSKMK